MSRARKWTRQAVTILDRHYDDNPTTAQAQLAAAGYQFTIKQVRNAAAYYRVSTPGFTTHLLGPAEPSKRTAGITAGWFQRRASVTTALAALAESRPTLAEYERRKAEILGGEA